MNKFVIFTAFAVLGVSFCFGDKVKHAKAHIYHAGGKQEINGKDYMGTVEFFEVGDNINGTIKSLTKGKHGFHVHEHGDLGEKCASAGAHYNPSLKEHGAPTDEERHSNQVATISITDKLIKLNGAVVSILKRSIVIHEKEDDLGKGSTEESKKTGDSGSRIACGIIEISDTNSGITAKFFAIQLWINFAILILFTKFLC